jgi:hypothetical protein
MTDTIELKQKQTFEWVTHYIKKAGRIKGVCMSQCHKKVNENILFLDSISDSLTTPVY